MRTGALLVVGIILWILPIWVGHRIGKPKGRAGGLWGFFLGWIGVIIVALLPPTISAPALRKRVTAPPLADMPLTRECPHCKEPMSRDAAVCPHCVLESRTDSSARQWLNERTH